MNATLHALAVIYRESSAAKSGTVKDYTLDWEKFLRAAGRHDGDDRELAELDLLTAEQASGGLFTIDRNSRTSVTERLRLKCDGGEAWLFAAIGLPSPSHERESLAEFFQLAALTPVPGADGWREESLVRYASAVICHDSKALENLRPRLLTALREITGREDVSLEDFGISDKPRSALIHGPLALELPGGRIDFGVLSGPVSVSATDLAAAYSVDCQAKLCLTVENESVFLELAKRKTGALLVQTSFPGSATRLLLDRLPSGLPCCHFGDSDPAGFDILRDLREKSGRAFRPVCMDFRPAPRPAPLTAEDRKTLDRILAMPRMEDVHPELRKMSEADSKGTFEQESVPLAAVIRWLATASEAARPEEVV